MQEYYKLENPFPNKFHKHLEGWDDLILQFLWGRGITSPEAIQEFIHYKIPYNPNPLLFKDMEEAAKYIIQTIRDGKSILVYGDYDVDGIMSTTILTRTLQTMVNYSGSKSIIKPFLPDRHRDGYGLKAKNVEYLYESGQLDNISLILTVDNGIKSRGVASLLASSSVNPIELIVFDHHDVEEKDFPVDALYVVNPKQDDCAYPEANICGSAVAYRLAEALNLLAPDLFPISVNYVEQFLPFACMGTIADIMPLTSPENRWFIYHGLQAFKDTEFPGILALIKETGLNIEALEVDDVGFSLGPAINASSRLETPNHAFYLFASDSEDEAIPYARKLLSLNDERKSIQRQYLEQMMDNLKSDVDEDLVMIELVDGCSHGVIGLLAAQLKDKTNKPSIVLTQGEDSEGREILGGSCRSFEEFNIAQALRANSDILLTYGGHAQAAGLTLAPDNLDKFRKAMNDYARRVGGISGVQATLHVDKIIDVSHINFAVYRILKRLEPLSENSLIPMHFVLKGVNVIDVKRMGDGSHIRVSVADNIGNKTEIVGFSKGHLADDLERWPKADLVVKIGYSDFRGGHVQAFLLGATEPQDISNPFGPPGLPPQPLAQSYVSNNNHLNPVDLEAIKAVLGSGGLRRF